MSISKHEGLFEFCSHACSYSGIAFVQLRRSMLGKKVKGYPYFIELKTNSTFTECHMLFISCTRGWNKTAELTPESERGSSVCLFWTSFLQGTKPEVELQPRGSARSQSPVTHRRCGGLTKNITECRLPADFLEFLKDIPSYRRETAARLHWQTGEARASVIRCSSVRRTGERTTLNGESDGSSPTSMWLMEREGGGRVGETILARGAKSILVVGDSRQRRGWVRTEKTMALRLIATWWDSQDEWFMVFFWNKGQHFEVWSLIWSKVVSTITALYNYLSA